jgi:hypothetical protein
VPLVLFSIYLPPNTQGLPAVLSCILTERQRDKRRSSGVISMDRFTLEHQVFLYDCYVKCKSARTCERKFRRKFPNVWAPHRNVIQNLVKKLWASGTLIDKKGKTTAYSINWRNTRWC